MKVYTSTGLPKQSTVDLLTAKGDLLTRSSSTNVRLAVGSDYKVPVALASATEGIQWGFAPGANVSHFVGSGSVDIRWTGAVTSAAPSTLSIAVGTIRAYPVFIPRPVSIDRIMFEVTTVGGAGSVGRAGIYASTSTTDPTPAALIYDGTEFACDSGTTKDKTISPAVALTGPAIYWFATLTGVAAPTLRTLVAGQVLPLLGWPAAGGGSMNTQVTRTFSYAALPDPFGSITSVATAAPAAVGIRVSSAP